MAVSRWTRSLRLTVRSPALQAGNAGFKSRRDHPSPQRSGNSTRPLSQADEDAGLSSRKRGFKSRRGHHLYAMTDGKGHRCTLACPFCFDFSLARIAVRSLRRPERSENATAKRHWPHARRWGSVSSSRANGSAHPPDDLISIPLRRAARG